MPILCKFGQLLRLICLRAASAPMECSTSSSMGCQLFASLAFTHHQFVCTLHNLCNPIQCTTYCKFKANHFFTLHFSNSVHYVLQIQGKPMKFFCNFGARGRQLSLASTEQGASAPCSGVRCPLIHPLLSPPYLGSAFSVIHCLVTFSHGLPLHHILH